MTDSSPACRSSTPSLFLSAVSDEFGDLRRRLDKYLSRQDVQVHEQKDFNQGGGTLLQHLDEYIRHCDAVLHVVGAQTGKPIKRAEAQWLLAAHPDFLDRFPGVSSDLAGDEPTLSYTQAEAWLALYYRGHGTRPDLFCYRPQALLDARPPESDSQERHWQRLRIEGKDRRGFADIGDLVGQMTHDLPRFEPAQRPCKLPFEPLGELFIGRDEFIRDLQQRVDRARENGRWPIHVVHGLGGVGKTRATVEYAWRYRGQYTAVLSVTADSPGALDSELSGLCGVLRINVADSATVPERIAEVTGWLRQHPGWMLLVDNVDTDEARDAVAGRLPQWAANGHVLITGRVTQWPRSVDPLDLSVLAPADAAKFLLNATAGRRKHEADDSDQALRLANDDLGCLCLALEQAAAYVAEVEISFADYRGRWATNADNVRGWADKLLMRYREAGGVSLSVATTWQTTFEQLTPPARAQLEMLSMLAPDPLPLDLLRHEAMTTALAMLVPPPLTASVERALAELRRYSMLSRVQGGRFESAGQVHRLVQLITRDWLATAPVWSAVDSRPPLAAMAVITDVVGVAIFGYWSRSVDDLRSWPIFTHLLPHMLSLAANGTPESSPIVSVCCGRAGGMLVRLASYSDAEPLLRRALAIDEVRCGPDHSEVAIDLMNLAVLLRMTNRPGEAEPLMRRALSIQEACYGSNHPRTAHSLNNLAVLLFKTNRPAEAEVLMRRALTIDEAACGPDHPNIAVRLNDLAQMLRAVNRLREAEPLMRRALDISEANYGLDHTVVATNLSNLAQLLQAIDRMGEAEPLMRRALSIDEASYGPNHPEVATDLNNLAGLLMATDRLSEAEPLMRRALLIDESTYGPEHPDVARDLTNLAGLLDATDRLAEAEPLIRRALSIDEISLGPNHPNVSARLNNLGLLLQMTNRLDDAEPLMRRASLIMLTASRAVGQELANTRIGLKNYAGLLVARSLSVGEVEDELRAVFSEAGLGWPGLVAIMSNKPPDPTE